MNVIIDKFKLIDCQLINLKSVINDPNVYNNVGRYPVLLSNSCYTGDIHTKQSLSLSEQYVLKKDKGSIAFLGSVSIGVAQFLHFITGNFYHQFGGQSYGKGVGDILKAAIINTEYSVVSSDSIERFTCMEMTIEGDPAVKMNLFYKPDYAISNNDLYFN